MRKKLPKYFIIFFLAVFILQMFALLLLVCTPIMAGAQVNFTPQISVGDFQSGQAQAVDDNSIGRYVQAIYNYGVGVVGILSTVVMMFGGILWLTSGGDSGKVAEAKEWIKAALFGLILVLLSYTILLTISPDLVNFRPISVEKIKQSTTSGSGGNLFGKAQYGINGFPSQASKLGYVKDFVIIDGASQLSIISDAMSSDDPIKKQEYIAFTDNNGNVIPDTYLDSQTKAVYSFYNDARDDGSVYIAVDKWVKNQ